MTSLAANALRPTRVVALARYVNVAVIVFISNRRAS
jgi:hypothetical protein